MENKEISGILAASKTNCNPKISFLSGLSAGCGCRGSGGQAKGHHRFSDSHDTSVAGSRREGWARHRGVPPCHPHPRGLCYPAQESQLWNLDHHPSKNKKSPFSLASCSVFKGSPPWLLAVLLFSCLLHDWKGQACQFSLAVSSHLSSVAQLQHSLKMDGWGLVNWPGMTQGG